MFLKIGFILAISADPDEMPPFAAFYLGLHYLPKYLFTGILGERVKKNKEHLNLNIYKIEPFIPNDIILMKRLNFYYCKM